MDYSTLAVNLGCDADGVLFDVHSLYACLLTLTDRRQRRGVRYPLALILVAIVLAKLSGEDKPTGIAEWARVRKELFIEAFGLSRPAMPGHNTYRRALAEAVRVDELEERSGEFLKQLPGAGTATQLTLDGKTVRGTI